MQNRCRHIQSARGGGLELGELDAALKELLHGVHGLLVWCRAGKVGQHKMKSGSLRRVFWAHNDAIWHASFVS